MSDPFYGSRQRAAESEALVQIMGSVPSLYGNLPIMGLLPNFFLKVIECLFYKNEKIA